jgi:hypothetical protein
MDIDFEHEASASYLVRLGDKSRELSSQERHPFFTSVIIIHYKFRTC